MEVNNDFARTMNKIIFDKFLEENAEDSEFYPKHLKLPPKPKDKEVIILYINFMQNKIFKNCFIGRYV